MRVLTIICMCAKIALDYGQDVIPPDFASSVSDAIDSETVSETDAPTTPVHDKPFKKTKLTAYQHYKDSLHADDAFVRELLFPDRGIERKTEYPSYDGWYNNPWDPSHGSAGTALIRLLPSDYGDGVQTPKKTEKPANPFLISDALMKEAATFRCENCSLVCSKTGKNVLMAFFGQFVTEEILNARNPSCPPDYFNIDIPDGHEFEKLNWMPFLRSLFDAKTGLSANSPRQQLNSATAWIDGSAVYGTSKAVAGALRSYEGGQLASSDKDGYFPIANDGYLSFFTPHLRKLPEQDTFRIGNPLGHENPFVLTFSIVFHRWHNSLAKEICKHNAKLSDEYCFNEARKWVIATLQHIIIDEWLPEFIGEELDPYERYDPSIDPSVSHAFQSAAMRFGQILIPSAVHVVNPDAGCSTSNIRVCNSFYNAKNTTMKFSIDPILLGMALQAAEVESPMIVDDIRRYLYGPWEFSRRDLMALNIQRGRDHGLPGYFTARNFMLPQAKFLESSFEELALMSNPEYKNIVETVLPDLYSSASEVDLWVGGLLETNMGPGPLFKSIIKEQFTRIRNGDRFWFENLENGLFTEDHIARIKNITFYDVIMVVTDKISTNHLPKKVFRLPTAADAADLECSLLLHPYPCKMSGKYVTCSSLVPLTDGCNIPEGKDDCINSELSTYDYFTGSGASFILSFLFLFFFIVGCILALLILVRKRHRRALARQLSVKHQKMHHSEVNSHVVTEWVGRKEGTRQIVVNFNAVRKHINLHHIRGQALRYIDLNKVQVVELQVSTSANLHYILVRIEREYDMILKFDSELEKANFIEKLETFLGAIGIGRQRYEVTVPQMLKSAFTKADRQAQLEKFFRVVFAQAFSIEHDQHELLNTDSNKASEIINTELTPYEFAEALSLRPDALFVKQMFALIDADGNGYISFREFLNVIVIFAKGGAEEKTKLLFDMYDINRGGKLTRDEFSSMIRSLMELANQSLSHDQMDTLIASMFRSAGLQNKPEMTFDDFSKLLANHKEEVGCIQLSFDVGSGFKTAPSTAGGKRKSVVMRAQETVVRAYSTFGKVPNQRQERGKSFIRVETKPVAFETDPTKQKVNSLIRFIENYKLHIFWTLLYTLVMFGIFIERAYYYSAESEHTNLRRIAGYGLTVTRGAASCMMFAYSTILLTMCRNTITFLRETFLHQYFPFDMAITFHKYIAFWGLAFTAIHAIGHGINFYHISTQTPQDLQCLFRDFHLDPKNPPKAHFWIFQTITGSTGVLLVIILALIYVFAIQYARRYVFNSFWATHNLYPILYILMILHGLGRLVQDPIFYYYFVAPCVLFALDRLISVSRKKVEISVVKAELLPSDVTYLEFKRPANFEYRSGQWVRIACVPLNKNEYHPFTLSSAPHEENLKLHIRAVGPWTHNLRNIYDPVNLQEHAYPKIYLDGPYGEGHQDWFRYDVSVLVGGGIGITPFASILKDIVFKANVRAKIACKKLYFIWVTRTQKHFEWMTDIIQEVEESDINKLVDVHIFITQFYQKFDLRTTMLYICERHFQRVSGRSLFTGLRSTTHFGRPDFKVFFESLQQEHPDVKKIALFSCGPPQMTRSVQLSCDELNKHEGAIFVHHFENF